jgi:hypothetical protein
MRSEAAQRHWENAIRGVARRVNLSAWLDRVAPWAFATGVVSGFAAYLVRRARGADPQAWLVLGLGAALVLCAVGAWAWWRSRKTFFREADARTLIEHRMQLDSALSAASAGVAPWPEPRPLPTTLRWRAPATLGWMVGALALALAGAWLPLPAQSAFDPRRVTQKPPALAQAEEWLEQLAAEEVARPEDVERLAEQARGLGERTPEERYSHSALEAADTLRAQTAQAVRGLAANFQEAAAALAPLERPASRLSDEELAAVAARLGEALRGLNEGPLAAREELARQFASAANAAGRRSLSPEQAAQLRQQLSRAGRAATGVLGAAGQGAPIATADPNRPVRHGHGNCSGGCAGAENGGECDGTCPLGSGGIARGPGHAPMMFREQASEAGAGRTETVDSEDLSRASLGELLAMERGEHEFDPKTSAGPQSAGAVSSPAQGGEVVWVDRLTPRERAALKDFFK